MRRWMPRIRRRGGSSRSTSFSGLAALFVLLGVALTLLALGMLGRVAPGRAPAGLAAGVCLVGLAAALVAPGGAAWGWFGIDGLSRVMLVALLLLGAVQGSPVVVGALVLAVLAADGVGLGLALGVAVLGAGSARRAAWVVGLVAVLLLLSWHGGGFDPSFATLRTGSPEGMRGVLVGVAAMGAAGLVWWTLPAGFGGVAGVFVLARLLLDLAGPVTPGWWGVPVVLLGAAGAGVGARRAAAAGDLVEAGTAAGMAAHGVAVAGLGVALAARGADLPGLQALAVAGALVQVVVWAVWGGLLALGTRAVQDGVGSGELSRLGGLLRRMPATGLSMSVALLSMAGVPLSAGFAGVWLVLQALLGAGRAGGTGLLALAALGVAALGLAMALQAAAAVRLAGVALLGRPRTAEAAEAVEPRRRVRLGMAALVAVAMVLGVWPWPVLALVQPGVVLLAGVPLPVGYWALAGAADAPGYVAPAVALLLVGAVGLAAWAGRGSVAAGGAAAGAAWRGGLAEEVASRGNSWPLALWPGWRRWRPELAPWMGVVALGVVLAAALGWAAR